MTCIVINDIIELNKVGDNVTKNEIRKYILHKMKNFNFANIIDVGIIIKSYLEMIRRNNHARKRNFSLYGMW